MRIKKILAERGFDPRTSGLWAQHASTAPLCFLSNLGMKNILSTLSRTLIFLHSILFPSSFRLVGFILASYPNAVFFFFFFFFFFFPPLVITNFSRHRRTRFQKLSQLKLYAALSLSQKTIHAHTGLKLLLFFNLLLIIFTLKTAPMCSLV